MKSQEPNKKKRVLLLIEQFGMGGAERQMCYLAVGLKKAGYDVRLVTFFNRESAYRQDVEAAGIRLEEMTRWSSPLKRVWAIRRLVKTWKPDVVITYIDGICMSACIARMFTSFRLIVSERNTTQSLSRRERIKFFLYRWADSIVCNSNSQGRFVRRQFKNLAPKTFVITNMLDTERFSPDAEKRDGGLPRILTTARIAPQKNVLNYLKALSLLKKRGVKARFDWFGTSDGEYTDKAIAFQRELGLDDGTVEFHVGGTKDVLSEYRKSTHYILPSSFEGFPNALCEAMSCGLICTASNICDNPDILPDNDFLFNPDSPEDIAEKIEKMLALDEEKALKERKINREAIIRLCSERAFIGNYSKLIKS